MRRGRVPDHRFRIGGDITVARAMNDRADMSSDCSETVIGPASRWQSQTAERAGRGHQFGGPAGLPNFPDVGESLGDFLLEAEIGRGSRGRCFLATQPTLSNRQVVLKIADDDEVEHLSLARLQHTHIMPLYSEHKFAGRGIRALCMPCLGGATLARVLVALSDVPVSERCGQSFLDVLDGTLRIRQWSQARESPVRRFLAQASYVRAICWITACLADALQYAHDRGLVHLDVKPSNILLTADGQPMLLDFHLARAPIAAGDAAADGIGGTPGYMSPEQKTRLAARSSGEPLFPAVDARSDIYSLGCVLAALLGWDARSNPGISPAEDKPFLRSVSPNLADLTRKCLAPDPDLRYPDAAALADDLRRHMADQPLRGVPNRNLREQWVKWCRRQPYELFRMKALLASGGVVIVIAILAWSMFLAPRFRAAASALREGRLLLDRREYTHAARALTRGAASVEGLPGSGHLSGELAALLRLADRLEEAEQLDHLVNRLRFLDSAAELPAASAREIERHCATLWKSRHSLLKHSGAPFEAQIEERLRNDLLDLAIVTSDLRVRLAAGSWQIDDAHRIGLRLLNEAEELFGPSHVLYRARQAHARAIGLRHIAETAGHDADRVPPRTAWEHDAVGRLLLANGDFAEAENAFARALALRPQDYWPNFHQGIAAFRLGRYADAVNAFRVCIALAPERADCFYNRALAYSALGDGDLAARDYQRAVQLDASLAARPLKKAAQTRPADHRAVAGAAPPAALDASGEHAANDMAVNVGQSARCAIMIKRETFMVETQQVQDRGVKIMNIDHIFDGLMAELIGGAEAEAMLDTGAGEPGGETLGIMISTRGPLLKRRHAAKLGRPHHQGVFKQSACLEIFQERGRRLIENRTMVVII